MSFEPTEKQKAAYRDVRDFQAAHPDLEWAINDRGYLSPSRLLADLAQHAMAAALALDFTIDHGACDECSNPCHKFIDADWLKLADEKLRKSRNRQGEGEIISEPEREIHNRSIETDRQ